MFSRRRRLDPRYWLDTVVAGHPLRVSTHRAESMDQPDDRCDLDGRHRPAGVSPAIESLRPELSESLKGRSATVTTGRRRIRLRSVLVAVQMAVSLLLVVQGQEGAARSAPCDAARKRLLDDLRFEPLKVLLRLTH